MPPFCRALMSQMGGVVGANSLVTKDVPPYAIVGGVPARVIRYRFSDEQIKELLALRWWELPMYEINSLPFDDIDECIRKIKEIRKAKQETEVLFVVTSVIDSAIDEALNYSRTRSIYTAKERNEQTIKTIKSIRKTVSNATVWLVEGGKKNYEGIVDYGCDRYIYVGDEKRVRKAVDSKYKGIGEVRILRSVLGDPEIKKYRFILKLSGRYYLEDDFRIDDFDYERFNFKNYETGNPNRYAGESSYRKGSHSTRLYGVPKDMVDVWDKALRKSVREMRLLHHGIENVMAKHIKGDVIFYRNDLHVAGNIGVNGEVIHE